MIKQFQDGIATWAYHGIFCSGVARDLTPDASKEFGTEYIEFTSKAVSFYYR